MKKKIPVEEHPLHDKVVGYMKEEAKLLKKHKLGKKLVITFKKHKKVPFFGAFGMWLVRKSGGSIDTMYTDAGGSK